LQSIFVLATALSRAFSLTSCIAIRSWNRYTGITKAAAKLDCRPAIIDGEVIIQNKNGISDFDALAAAFS
jgi:hypothetical protein